MSPVDAHNGISLARLLPGKWLPAGVDDTTVSGICLDNRRLAAGDLFIAVPGARHDGRRFIAEAVKAGAAAVFKQAESAEETVGWQNAIPVIPVAGLNEQISAIAGRFYGEPSAALNVIGITGTNGKTTSSHLLAQLQHRLNGGGAVVGTLGYGAVGNAAAYFDQLTETGLTTADGITTQAILAELRDRGANAVAMEVSSHALEQHRVAAVQFVAALYTNLTQDHLDYHGDMEAYAQAKRKLFDFSSLQHRVVNIDDEFGRRLAAELRHEPGLLTYSLGDRSASVHTTVTELTIDGIRASVATPWGEGTFRSQLFGEFNLYNLLGVITTCCAMGHHLDRVLTAVEQLIPVPGRMQPVTVAGGPSVVVDYSHTPDSLQRALQALQQHAEGKLWCVFGCGGDRDRAKRPLMASIAERHADRVVVTNDNPRTEAPADIFVDINAGFERPEAVNLIEDRAEAIAYSIDNAAENDCILIAGKGHETYQLIGEQRLPFSDVKQARLALRARGTQQQRKS